MNIETTLTTTVTPEPTAAETLLKETEVMVEIAKALQGLTDAQASRVVRAAAILYDVELVRR